MTLPYPEPGIRLIRQDQVQTFDDTVRELNDQLQEAVDKLDQHYAALQSGARESLGSLYNAADYPPTLKGLFGCAWEFPSVTPPDYLRRLNPGLFEQEKQRMSARFEEAVRLATDASTAEFAHLVGHLAERIGSGPDKKVFRDSAVDGLKEFFERFKTLNIHSSAQLDELVETAQKAVAGVAPQDLRDSESLRQQISGQMAGVLSALDGLLVDAPRRKLLRSATPTGQGRVMEIISTPGGIVHAIYGEEIALEELGALSITRASFVKPAPDGMWWADLAPVAGPKLGPFTRRSEALTAEHAWLQRHWLKSATTTPTTSPTSHINEEDL